MERLNDWGRQVRHWIVEGLLRRLVLIALAVLRYLLHLQAPDDEDEDMDKRRILRFGAGARAYDFSPFQQQFMTNFSDLVPRTTRLPYAIGGYDEYGRLAAPNEVGKVTLNFTIEAATQQDMAALRDAVNEMSNWGVQPLWMQESDRTAPVRWTMARINNINMSQRLDTMPDYWQKVTVVWQVAKPRWYSKAGLVFFDDDDLVWGPDTGGTPGEFVGEEPELAGDEDVIEITHVGSAPADTVIFCRCMGGTVVAPGLKRIDPDTLEALEAWRWDGTLEASEYLVVNGEKYAVEHHSSSGKQDAYGDFEQVAGIGFITLEPGVNRLVVSGTFDEDAEWTIEYLDTWR